MKIQLAFDGDAAGVNATFRAFETMVRSGQFTDDDLFPLPKYPWELSPMAFHLWILTEPSMIELITCKEYFKRLGNDENYCPTDDDIQKLHYLEMGFDMFKPRPDLTKYLVEDSNDNPDLSRFSEALKKH